jgi:hypothetical protein
MNPLFLANGGLGTRIDANDVSQRAELVGDGDSVVATVIGDAAVFIRFGRSDVVATTACYPILPVSKEDEIMLKGASGSWVAAICEAGQSATLIIHRVSR